MNTNTPLKIVIAESSVIIRSGLAVVLRRLPNLSVQPVEIATPESLTHYMQMHTPDIVIANPNFGGWFDLTTFKAAHEKSGIRYMALISSVTDPNMLKAYDGHFSICDDLDTIAAQINQILHTEEPDDQQSHCRQAFPLYTYHYHTPAEHCPQAANTLTCRTDHLCHRQQVSSFGRHQAVRGNGAAFRFCLCLTSSQDRSRLHILRIIRNRGQGRNVPPQRAHLAAVCCLYLRSKFLIAWEHAAYRFEIGSL